MTTGHDTGLLTSMLLRICHGLSAHCIVIKNPGAGNSHEI